MRTVAGVTLNWYGNRESRTGSCGRWLFGLNQSYAELPGKADMLPLGIIPFSEDFRRILETVDILIMTGGGDPDPELYGQRDNGSINSTRERPLWEMGLYRTAREMGLPILGICLGIQLIGIAEGVGLIQDIPTQVDDPLHHHGTPERPAGHPVSLLEGTLLYSVLGDTAEVSSFHHQALCRVPDGFRPAAFAADGVIEAVESDDGRVVAVQWHPERDLTGPVILRGMSELVRERG